MSTKFTVSLDYTKWF